MMAVTAPVTAPSLQGAVAWINSKPLTLTQLRGKVVLIDFWTYTCVNWRRTLPYVRAWAEKYKGNGLVVVGVHTPEFSFEKNLDNVRWAVNDMRVDYPVAVDSNNAIWNSFANEYWPALYILDSKGQIRAHQFGEGGYVEAERKIQALLTETGKKDVDRSLVSVHPVGLEIAADWADLQSAETYVGYERGADFSSPGDSLQMSRDFTTFRRSLRSTIGRSRGSGRLIKKQRFSTAPAVASPIVFTRVTSTSS